MADELGCINLSGQPFSLSFHPSKPILAVGVVNGVVEFHGTSEECLRASEGGGCADRGGSEGTSAVGHSVRPFMEDASCLSVVFHPVNQNHLYSASSAGEVAVHDIERQGAVQNKFLATALDKKTSAGVGVNCIAFSEFDKNVLWAGDDNGVVRLFDIRTASQGRQAACPARG